ncbi:hypothetical protein [Thermovenabulum gondwanense]|uniref:Uncharacterized protein n=1 Tax=Thermovenabulum gondwanense TaxID=520767 RepID=A0A162MRE6_9FIRM|nr:hypothetical protein [Thermovenabulum gondwanense]KYO66999.1 hypothetical protein ATZ99_08160 [Thermovenabulum gondwanense]
MSKKFIRLIIVLILTVVILLSQAINTFALSYYNNTNSSREDKLKDTVIMLIGSPNAYV